MPQPDPLPLRLLTDPQFVQACANRKIGSVFHLAKLRAGVFPSQIARLTGLTTSRVTEYMSGDRVVSAMDVIERIADGLRIPGRMLGLANRPWETITEPAAHQPAAIPETWEVLDMLSRSTVSAETLAHLERAVADVVYRYPMRPLAESVSTLQRQLVSMHQLLGRPQQLAARRSCIRILTVVSGMLAFAYHDLGDRGRSEAHFDLGAVAAREGETDDLAAWLATMQSIVEYTAGRRDTAAVLLQQAAALAEASGPRRRAWVAANLARSLAARGEHTQALTTLDQAAHLLDLADEPLGGLDFFTAPRLDGLAGETYAHLGEHEAAASLLERAIRSRDEADVRGRSVQMIDVAECRLGQGDIDAACATAHSALDLAGDTVVHRLDLRARQFQHALGPWESARPVRELTARVRESTHQLVRS